MNKILAKSGYYLNSKTGFNTPVEAFNALLTYVNMHKDNLDIINVDANNLHIQIKLSNKNNNVSRYVPLPCLDLTTFKNAYLRASATYICKYENGKLVLVNDLNTEETSNIWFNIQCVKFPDTCEIFIKNIDISSNLNKKSILSEFFKVGILSYTYSIIKTNLSTLKIEEESGTEYKFIYGNKNYINLFEPLSYYSNAKLNFNYLLSNNEKITELLKNKKTELILTNITDKYSSVATYFLKLNFSNLITKNLNISDIYNFKNKLSSDIYEQWISNLL